MGNAQIYTVFLGLGLPLSRQLNPLPLWRASLLGLWPERPLAFLVQRLCSLTPTGHTRRGKNDLHLLPCFAKVEEVVEKALASFHRDSRFSKFGYMLEASEREVAQLLLRRLEADLHQVQQLLQLGACYNYNPRSVASWTARVASVTARIEERMASIGQ